MIEKLHKQLSKSWIWSYFRLLYKNFFIKNHLKSQNFDDISEKISKILKDKNYKGKLKDIYDGFCEESYGELFDSQSDAITYYSNPENYKLLEKGDIGDNLLGKYSAIGLLALDEIITTIF